MRGGDISMEKGQDTFDANQSAKFLSKARDALIKGDREEALRCAVEGLKQNPTGNGSAELNRIAAGVLLESGSVKLALNHAEKAMELSTDIDDYMEGYRSTMLLGQVLARMDRYTEALFSWNKALDIGRQNKDVCAQSTSLLNLAMLEQRFGNHERAIQILAEAEDLLKNEKDLRLLATCCSRKTLSFMETGKIDLALDNCMKLEEIARKSGIKPLIASSNFRKGTIYLDQDDYEKALVPLQTASDIYKELGDNKNLALTLCNLASTYIGLEQPDEVDMLLKEVVTLARGVDSTLVMSEVQLVLAEMAVFRHNAPQIDYCYEEFLRLAEEIGNEERFKVFHESIGKSLNKLGFEIFGIKRILERARTSYKKLGLKKELKELDAWLERVPG